MKAVVRILSDLMCVVAVGKANAALITYDFSYEFDSFTSISGIMEGTESSGIVTISDIIATITSTGGSLGASVFSFDTTLGGFLISGDSDEDPGTLALDGSMFDLAVIALPESNVCASESGFGFCLIESFASVNMPEGFASFTTVPENFYIAEQTTSAEVSSPAALGLLTLGLLSLMASSRRKKVLRVA